MKRILATIILIAFGTGAFAQGMFDFSQNSRRFEIGLNLGQAGSFSPRADFGVGVSLALAGFYLDCLVAEPQHKFDHTVSNRTWNDTEAFCINAGYQIPIFSWLRIMPLVGYAQTNEGVTDGSSLNWSYSDSSTTFYHQYTVTPGSRIHSFNYGGGLSVQPCRWLSINAVATRCALYGGIAINLFGFGE